MSVEPAEADAFSRWLAHLCGVLAKRNRSIYEIGYDLLAFGSWVIVVGTRHRRLRLTWDGKEHYLSIEVASFPSSGTVAVWVDIDDTTLSLPNGHATIDSASRIAQFVAQHT